MHEDEKVYARSVLFVTYIRNTDSFAVLADTVNENGEFNSKSNLICSWNADHNPPSRWLHLPMYNTPLGNFKTAQDAFVAGGKFYPLLIEGNLDYPDIRTEAIIEIGRLLSNKSPVLFSEVTKISLIQAVSILGDMVITAKPIVENDARMMADLSRFAPLSPEDQAKHDSTQYPSERWLNLYSKFTNYEGVRDDREDN